MRSSSIYYCLVFLATVIYIPSTAFFNLFRNTPIQEVIYRASKSYTGPTATYAKTFPSLTTEKIASIKAYLNQDNEVALIRTAHEIMRQETAADRAGRLTFLHGEPSSFHVQQQLYKVLLETTRSIQLNNYVFTRFPDQQDWAPRGMQYGAIKRQKLMAEGGLIDYFTNTTSSPNLVFMSPSLFTHKTDDACLYYFAKNNQCKEYENSLDGIFKKFNLQNLYPQYESQLHELNDLYIKTCPFGQILLFNFSPHAVQKTVFASHLYGYKIPKYYHEDCWENILELYRRIKENPDRIFYDSEHHTHNHDHLQFCFVPTTDCGLNPDIAGKDIQIHTITGADPKKMAEYLVKEQELTDQIRSEIQRQ